MEALLLAGGKAERLGEAAQGLPKPLVPIAGFPLAEYGVARLVGAGVSRVMFMIGETNVRSRRAVEKIGGRLTDRLHHAEMAGQPVTHVIYTIDRGGSAE